MILELLNCPLAAIRVRAIHLLGLSLSTADGNQLDNKYVLQFEALWGFQTMSENLSHHDDDNESVLDAILNLMYWRRGYGSPSHIYTSSKPRPQRLSAINEVSMSKLY
jgi:hypothetical protein